MLQQAEHLAAEVALEALANRGPSNTLATRILVSFSWFLGRIGGNNFSGKILEFIGQWISLESLRIQASGLEGPIPYNITLLESLTDLRISDLRRRDTPIPPFSSTTRFKNLDFRFNKLNGSIPIGFAELNRTDSMWFFIF
ncbi:putative transferase [Helianthus annuus]|nr:putative transferase [Helianthus annuus]